MCHKFKYGLNVLQNRKKDSALTQEIDSRITNHFGQSVAITLGRSCNGVTTQC